MFSPIKYFTSTVGKLFSPTSKPAPPKVKDAAEPAKVKAKKGVAGKKPKKTAPKRSIKKPKRAKSAYVIFAEGERSKIVASQPSLDGKEVTKLVASAWKKVSKGDKATFENQAKVDEKRFDRETKAYEKAVAKTSATGKKASKPKKVWVPPPAEAAHGAKELDQVGAVLAKHAKPKAMADVTKMALAGNLKMTQILIAAKTYRMTTRSKKCDPKGFLTELFGVAKAKALMK